MDRIIRWILIVIVVGAVAWGIYRFMSYGDTLPDAITFEQEPKRIVVP